jgi:alpha-pyrone synthase
MSYLWKIATAVPNYVHQNEDFVNFYCATTGENSLAQRKIKAVAHRSGIQKRYSVLKDFSVSPENFEFFPKNALLSPSPSLTQRMAIYKKEALLLATKSITQLENFETIKADITHLITVTCTGLFAPGLDIELMEVLDLKPSTHRSSVNFMGCNAAVLALKQAHYICQAEPNSLVLVVCVELCTLHFQADFDDDYIISNQLFADGSAAVLVGSNSEPNNDKSLKINHFQSLVIHEGRNEMAWQLSENGFKMNLTSYVSPLINKYMPTLVQQIKERVLKGIEKVHWAVHPGGKRILDDFAKTMSIEKTALAPSYQTLNDFGNMSSPTVLFVLKNLLENQKISDNEAIVLAAFGPGLNIETMTLKSN